MKRTKLLSCIALVAVILFILVACGKGEPKNPNLMKIGDYELLYKSACIMEDYGGNDALVVTLDFTNNTKKDTAYIWSIVEFPVQNKQELEFAMVYVNEESDVMVSDGQLTDIAPGETIEIKTAFALLDTTNKVEIRFEEIKSDKNASITIDPSTLSRETATSSAATSDTETNQGATVGGVIAGATSGQTPAEGDADIALLDWWNGDWYGWWVMTGCFGGYEDMEGDSWDICGNIDIGEDYTGTVTLWDEDYTKSSPMVVTSVSLNKEGTGEHGTMMSEEGYFTDIDLEHADWIVDPGLLEYPNMIHIDGYYESGDDEYHYDIFLRPWGTKWDDVEAEDLPAYYEDWYLPLIEANKAMPDSMDAA